MPTMILDKTVDWTEAASPTMRVVGLRKARPNQRHVVAEA